MSKYWKVWTLFALMISFACTATVAQYRAVISSAGGEASSNSYSIKFTLGEPIPGGVASSANYRITTGFYGGDVFGPVIPTPVFDPTDASEGSAVTVSSSITDAGSGVDSATLRWGIGGGDINQQCPMTDDGSGIYSCSIGGDAVQPEGLKYLIEAVDNSGNQSQYPAGGAENIPVSVVGESQSITTGSYRMISSPFTLSNRSFSTLIEALTNEPSEWRWFELNRSYADSGCQDDEDSSACYTASPSSMAEGTAYWIITSVGGTLSTGPGTTFSVIEPFPRQLHKGWNMVGNPFNFSVPVSQMTVAGVQPNIQRFTGSGWAGASSLERFSGVLVDGGENGGTLEINPMPAASKSAGKTGVDGTATNKYAPTWAVEIEAWSGDLFDVNNFAGVHSEAKSEWDLYDRPEPLLFGDYISLYFPHKEWGKVHRSYAADIRSEENAGDTWHFKVASAVNRAATLKFKGLDQVPMQYSVHLVDRKSGRTQDLRLESEYSMMAPGNGNDWPLELVIGESAFVEDILEEVEVLPEQFELDQNYPNPFNPTTSIRYGITENATVSLSIYNVLGQEVRTLVNNETRTPGFYTAIWDARSHDGALVASGLYVYQLRIVPTNAAGVGETLLTKKMMFVK